MSRRRGGAALDSWSGPPCERRDPLLEGVWEEARSALTSRTRERGFLHEMLDYEQEFRMWKENTDKIGELGVQWRGTGRWVMLEMVLGDA